ncbi:hypothetical protein M2113_001029 [Aurantimicrobium minutum]|uniref:HNH endonuclease n=1 Tax=Aurantimicrobium minutum TaxID=708131 RepID=UPI0024758180|nr:HNH endonuclease [Aurantimicrobium minutum]MDH6410055.1 hypothetical protein [Aurantimicrobium minutum]
MASWGKQLAITLKKVDPFISLYSDANRNKVVFTLKDAKWVSFYISKSSSKGALGAITISEYRSKEPLEVKSMGDENTSYWLVNKKLYSVNDKHLTSADVTALLNESANKRRLQLEKAHALQSMVENYDQAKRRSSIPQQTKIEVWQRDQGRCTECGNSEKLEFDHIIPVSMGGSDTVRNLQLLCEPCNRRKGASLG